MVNATTLTLLKKKKKKEEEQLFTPAPAGTFQSIPPPLPRPSGRSSTPEQEVDILERDGKKFVLPKRETKKLLMQGDISLGDLNQPSEARRQFGERVIAQNQPEQLPLSPEERGRLDLSEVTTGVAADLAPNAATAAAAGIVAASTGIGAPVAPLIALGAFAALTIRSVIKNAKQESQQNLSEATAVTVKNRRTTIKGIINYANQGGDPEEAWRLYQDQLSRINKTQSILKISTQNDLNKFLSDEMGAEEMARIENFLTFEKPILDSLMYTAMIAPDKNKILEMIEDVENEE